MGLAEKVTRTPVKAEAAPALYRLLSDSALSRAALGACGLPLGVQLVGRKGYDARLMRTARWLEKKVSS